MPSGISTGDDYAFSVVVIDVDGLRSQAATITSNSTLYSVIYDGNGHAGGTVPADSLSYRQTKPVIVLDSGTMVRSGYSFNGWNTAADGSGTSFAAGNAFAMQASDITLYAQWIENGTVTVMFVFNPSYGAIAFSSSSVTVERGTMLQLTTLLAGAVNWHLYVDSAIDSTQTASTFRWDTTGAQPGDYIINADAVYQGHACTGSIQVTVFY